MEGCPRKRLICRKSYSLLYSFKCQFHWLHFWFLFFMLVFLWLEISIIRLFSNFAIIAISMHGLISTLVMIYIHTPYRAAAWSLFGKKIVQPGENSKKVLFVSRKSIIQANSNIEAWLFHLCIWTYCYWKNFCLCNNIRIVRSRTGFSKNLKINILGIVKNWKRHLSSSVVYHWHWKKSKRRTGFDRLSIWWTTPNFSRDCNLNY